MNKYILHNSALLREDMFVTDKAFITNAIKGVKWTGSFEEKNTQLTKLQIGYLIN